MYVTRLSGADFATEQLLIKQAALEANYFGLEKIVFWCPVREQEWKQVSGVLVEERKDSLSSMVCFVDGVQVKEPFNWVCNDKYAWI